MLPNIIYSFPSFVFFFFWFFIFGGWSKLSLSLNWAVNSTSTRHLMVNANPYAKQWFTINYVFHAWKWFSLLFHFGIFFRFDPFGWKPFTKLSLISNKRLPFLIFWVNVVCDGSVWLPFCTPFHHWMEMEIENDVFVWAEIERMAAQKRNEMKWNIEWRENIMQKKKRK